MTVNYQRLQFAGNCFTGIFLAAAFTFFGYKATNENPHALIFFPAGDIVYSASALDLRENAEETCRICSRTIPEWQAAIQRVALS